MQSFLYRSLRDTKVFLFHYAPFQPLWERNGLVQCGPLVLKQQLGVPSINEIKSLKDSLSIQGFNPKGILIHYTDPFIIRANALQGLKHWNGPKLLVCGDLHHGPSPIETLIQYQKNEFHDSIILAFNPMLLEKVKAELNVPVHSNPPSFFSYPQRVRNISPIKALLHIGSIGSHHPKRRKIVESLLDRKKIPFFHSTTNTAEEAADLYSKYTLVLNIPLNNDLNHRFFEVIASGVPQIIFGAKELLGQIHHLKSLKGVYWAESIEKIEELVLFFLHNPEKLTYPNQAISQMPIKDFLLNSLRAN